MKEAKNEARLELASDRVFDLLKVLEMMAAGDTEKRLEISDRHDELDAIAHGINVLVGELGWATARAVLAEQDKAARAERESLAKNVFFRNMSHELRTPIAAMLGFADLLGSAGPTHLDRPEMLKRLQANGRAVLSLLDDLLDLAKLDADKVVLVPEQVGVADLVREVLASQQLESRAKGLQMRVEAPDAALGPVRTDRYRLRQVLVNLVSNAVKFTDTGSVTVTLGVMPAGDEWTVDVTDTGIGIEPDRRTRIFEPFEQADESIAQSYGGNGLGLALSRKLADQLGGSLVLLYSAPGEGTTFRLTVKPLKAAPAHPVVAAPAVDTAGSIAGLHLLLAEDHRDLHLALRELLEQAGATVESVHDGREAVARASTTNFDAVLMDLRMPNMDGVQATRALRSLGCAVPIIALTADPATLRRAEALNAGCDACLSKPFKPDDLISAIRLSTRPSAV